jgi:hypothetical protein
MNLLCMKSFAHKKHNRTLLFGRIRLKHGLHFAYRNQPLYLRMRVCYLDCHEAGLYCYLVIHVEHLIVRYSCFIPFVTYLLTVPCNHFIPK